MNDDKLLLAEIPDTDTDTDTDTKRGYTYRRGGASAISRIPINHQRKQGALA